MNSKIKILIGILLTGIILAGAWGIWKGAGIPFEKCIKASSFADYYKKAKINVAPEDMDRWISRVSIPIRINLSDIEIYSIPSEVLIPHVFTKPIIKSGNLYCELTDNNVQKLFAPIQAEEAIKYLNFRLVTLGEDAYATGRSTIWDKEDYESLTEDGHYFCDEPISDSEKRITTFQETEDGFLINWIYYTPYTPAGYYEKKVNIGYDLKIQTIEEMDEPFVDCGEGIII